MFFELVAAAVDSAQDSWNSVQGDRHSLEATGYQGQCQNAGALRKGPMPSSRLAGDLGIAIDPGISRRYFSGAEVLARRSTRPCHGKIDLGGNAFRFRRVAQ